MSNQTIDGVPRELLENFASYSEGSASGEVQLWVKKLRALLDADKVNNRQMGLMQYVEAHPIKPAAQPQGEPVAFIQIPKNIEKYGHGDQADRLSFGKPGQFFVNGDSPMFDFVLLYAEHPATAEGDPIGSFDKHMEYTADNIRLKSEVESLRKKADRYDWLAKQAETESSNVITMHGIASLLVSSSKWLTKHSNQLTSVLRWS